ncbi:DEAD/DEAH box helicase domain protein [Natrinema pellirubrum DSM 15624]|uniref:DEAD/DEAH box helicase domain protein n=1 Tax=Natrinema pellirubrum (strain DSM 15624 / CIP 106293 / JCM 10476 / NCIMB 786 / 157) TaxID=797303 RepID=L0JKB1_NATP1|nr:DEAD/DEAH box helicase [Natrinema pellirubrum]AGB31022.1 helicase family protein with metal-binding cysteine cluster [Natrinema pellirubrum DSM 15624]ELY81133.1 DEAD/DEAH box helicase domain protein [Natrinema pellirubrum DSM 15624]
MRPQDSDGPIDGQDDTGSDGLALTAEELRETYPDARYGGQCRERFILPAESADHVPAREVLPPDLAAKLAVDPWSHQANALAALERGENVCVTTSTSSGKTYVYALEIARRFRENPDVRALLVYPTKALSRDQERELNDLFDDLGLDVTVGVYDGDTKRREKSRIREEANVVITNFAGLNQYLEGHHRWAAFHAGCDLLVVDEAHAWTGISGMHAAWILRRAQRVIEWYGGDPQYVLTSATIGNPADHAEALTGEPATVIDEDGSPSGRRHLVFWDPPTDGDAGEGGDGDDWRPSKRPATVEAPEVWAHCCYHGVPSLLFCDSRKGTELAVGRAQEFLETPSLPYSGSADLAAYNAGHGKRSRRSTENRLKSGNLDGVATTSALEVGIDVGGIDGTVLLGYPGSRQSFWQRIGRSGRGEREALSVFVPSHSTLDQYVLNHPEYLLEEEPESAVVDLENNPVYLQHLRCAAQELPLRREDAARFGGRDRLEQAVEYGRRTGEFEGSLAGGITYAHRDRPQDEISLYASGGDSFEVRLAGEGSIDHQPIGRARAYRDYHEGATVLYRGDQYEVVELREDRPQPYVELEAADLDYYTQSQRRTTIYDTEIRESRDIGDFRLNWGYGTVTVHHETFLKRDLESGDVRTVGLETGVPPLEMRTQLCWAEVPADVERAVTAAHSDYHNDECEELPPRLHGYLGGIHAVEHAMIAVAPLELTVDAADLGGLATNRLPDGTDASGWFIYDGIEGGLGFSRRIYEEYEAVARRARDLWVDCDCGRDEGCPACLMSDRCGNDNRPLYGPAARDVIDSLLDEGSADYRSDLADEDRDERRPPASIS